MTIEEVCRVIEEKKQILNSRYAEDTKNRDFKFIEDKWQKRWKKEKNFKAVDFHPTKPKYSAEHAFNVIRTLNCSLEDKLKIAELFEYSE